MIIFINGSINAGKSTVAEKLAKKFDKPALVEIDNIGAFFEWMDSNIFQPHLFRRLALIPIERELEPKTIESPRLTFCRSPFSCFSVGAFLPFSLRQERPLWPPHSLSLS